MSPDTHWMVQFAGGFILASAAWFAWLSVVVTNHTKESKKAARTIFNLNELITHLRQQKSPIYQVGVGVDPVARRNPKTTIESLPFLEAGDWGDSGGMVHQVGEQDTWNPEAGEYNV